MSTLFKVKTVEGYVIKTLSELLQNNVKVGSFDIDDTGMNSRMIDSKLSILFDVKLISENFTMYSFSSDKTIHMGLNMSHLYKMLKSVKKKDSMVLYIDSKNPTDLNIEVIPKENNRKTTSCIKIQPIQNIEYPLPTGYGKPINIPSNEYQKMIKDLASIGDVVDVVGKRYKLCFKCDAESVYKREIEFGQDDDNSDSRISSMDTYSDTFSTSQLVRISKISGLGSTMQIYFGKNLPLLFRSSIGNLGTISIYVKSKQQIRDSEQKDNMSDDDDH